MNEDALALMTRALQTSEPRLGDLMSDNATSGNELLENSHRNADLLSQLRSSGRAGSDRVVVAVPRSFDSGFLAWVIGSHLDGAIVAPLYPTLRPKEREAVLSVLRPDVIVTDSDKAIDYPQYSFDSELGALVASNKVDRHPLPAEADLVLYSSGSTGEPKGILVNGAAFLRSARQFGERLGIEVGANYFCPLPMAHSGGLIMGWWASALHGAVMLGSATNDFEVVANRLAEVKPDIVGAVDTFFYRWSKFAEGRSLGRIAWTTGDETTLDRVQRGCGFEHVVRPYGLTEASPNVGVGDPNRADGSPADPRIWVHDGIDVRIDSAGIDEAIGVGEILVGGSCISPGYLMPSGIVPVSDADGWLHTGDLGYFDSDGALQFVGRLKEMLKVGGLNVWPQEIEAALQELKIDNPMCVVGRRDDEYGERPVLVVEGQLSGEQRDRVARALGTLPRIKQPNDVVHFDAFPSTASGKMDRRAITKLVNER